MGIPVSIRILAVVFAFVVSFAAGGNEAQAFCVYNKAQSPVSVLQLPISESSYKAVVKPGGSDCCNWRECGGKRYDQSLFVVYTGNHRDGLDSITRERVWEKVEMGVDVVTTVLPGGQAFKVVSTGVKVAKIALKAKKFATQLKKLEKVHRKLNKAKKYKSASRNIQKAQKKINQVLADIGDKIDPANLRCDAVSAYNGGVLNIGRAADSCNSCWFGPCRSHGVNYDGTVGPQPSDLRGRTNIAKLSDGRMSWDWAGPGYGIPDDAVAAGWEGRVKRNVCMAEHFNGDTVLGIHPGKVVTGKCNYGYGGREFAARDFWVLKGYHPLVHWKRTTGYAGKDNVVGGYERGRLLHVCRGYRNGSTHPGKLIGNRCNYGYGHKEISTGTYDVFVRRYAKVGTPVVVKKRLGSRIKIVNASGRCLQAPGGKPAPGTEVVTWMKTRGGCLNSLNHFWVNNWKRDAGAPQPIKWAAGSGLCVGAPAGGTGDVALQTCSGDRAQKWTWDSDGRFVSAAGRCLTETAALSGRGYSAGQKLALKPCSGAKNQRWEFLPDRD